MYYRQFLSITLMQQYKDGHKIILLRGGTYNCNPEIAVDNILFVDFVVYIERELFSGFIFGLSNAGGEAVLTSILLKLIFVSCSLSIRQIDFFTGRGARMIRFCLLFFIHSSNRFLLGAGRE